MVSSKTYTALKIILALVLVGLTVLIVFLILPRPDTDNDLVNSMDGWVNPCNDFYGYTCGRWTKYHPPPQGVPMWSKFVFTQVDIIPKIISLLQGNDSETDNQAIRKARKVYRVCIDGGKIEKTGEKSFLSYINDNGGWPLAMERGDWDSQNTTWQQVYSKLAKTTSIGSLFQLEVIPDFKDTSISRVLIMQPELPITREELLSPDEPDLMAAYTFFKMKVLNNLRKLSGVSDEIDTAALAELNNFEKELAKISKELLRLEDYIPLSEWMSVDDLQNVYDSANMTSSTAKIDWLEMIGASFTTLTPEITIDKSEELIVVDKTFFVKLAELLNKTSHETIVNYIMWSEVQTTGVEVQEFRKLAIDFNKHQLGVDAPLSWNFNCALKSSMDKAVAYAFVKNISSLESKEVVHGLVENIQEATKRYIGRSAWLDNETISLANEKIDAMIKLIHSPDNYNDAALDDFYSEFVPTNSHFDNTMKMDSFQKKKNIDMLRKPTDKKAWIVEPDTVNAFYNPLFNAIVVPAGFLQEPFFKMNRSSVLHYGMLGTIIGHEISHALDSNGRQFDKNGNSLPWWSQATIDQYEEHEQCFIDQYSKFKIFDDDSTVIPLDGNFTLAENLADSTGLQVTWEAYKIHREKHGKNEDKISGLEGYTDDQLFFLTYGNLWCSYESDDYMKYFRPHDTHSPSRARVNGAVSNIQDFAKAFDCPANSPMNPTKKCNIWN